VQVYANHLVPLLKRVLNDSHPGPEQTGIVDERIDRLKSFNDGIDDPANIDLFADVTCATINLCVGAVIAQLAHGCRNLLLVASADKHAGAFTDVRSGDGFADAASGSGDQSNAINHFFPMRACHASAYTIVNHFMKSISTHHRLLIFLLIVLALAGILSPWFALGADWVAAQMPGMERFPFSRIFNRTFMFSGIVLFFLYRRLLRIGNLAELGFVSVGQGAGDLLRGWSLAVGSLLAVLLVMSVAQVFEPFFRLSLSRSLSRFFSALLSGVFTGSLEEIFFRGILFKGLLQNSRLFRAFVLSSLFYSALHFVKPGEPYFIDVFDPLAGFRHLSYTFRPFLEPFNILPGMFGLFLIGVVLSYAFLRTGNLYLSIGLHAGWVFGLKSVRVFGDYARDDLGWLFGSTDPKIVSGVATWIGIVSVLLLVHWMTRNRCGLTSDPMMHPEVRV
jgi:uncharacterized protein